MRTRSFDRETVRVVGHGDIHDIRVLTATGPIELPGAASAEPRQQKA